MGGDIEGLTGVLLAGGKSSRFGSDKALAAWDGGTLIEAALDTYTDLFPRVLVLTKDPQSLKFLESEKTRVVADASKSYHPLEGILTALREAGTDKIFVSACDMPYLSYDLIRKLWWASSGYAATVPIWGGRPQPLCSIYSKECLGVIKLLLKEEKTPGVKDLFGIVRTRFFQEEEVREVDPEGRSFIDIDTPEDYRRFGRSVA